MVDDDFNIEEFEKKLANLKDTQESIQHISKWCLEQRRHHKKIVSGWLNVLKQDRVEHRLTLFYLANDVIQYSKRKHYEFVDSWGTALQRATTMVRDDRVREKISRIFNIWKTREIYSEEYISDLHGLLNMNPIKKKIQQEEGDEYQNTKIIGNINDCVRLGSETDKAFKNLLIRSPNFKIDTIKTSLKDKRHSEDIGKDVDNIVTDLEGYLTRLKNEVKSRKLLIKHIDQADTFYGNQKGEVKVVFNAYKNFGARMKLVKKKLDELTVNLPSPIPSPDINAPSPEPDADITLPGEVPSISSLNMNLMSTTPANGYTSYMEGNLPFDINDFKSESSYGNGYDHTQSIQVINTRSDDQNAEASSQNFSNSDKPYSLSTSMNYTNTSLNYGSQNNSYSLDTSYNPIITTRNNNAPSILQPPPMAPSLDICNDFDTWNVPSTLWSSSSFGSIDTPVSPPQYETESNTSLIEYREENDNFMTLKDVDHRKLSFPQTEPIKENGRLADVDHRNLIPLTGGSPRSVQQKKNFDDVFQVQFTSSNDVDHRAAIFNSNSTNENLNLLKPPPLPPILGPPPGLSPLLGAPMHLPGLHTNDIDIREKPPSGNIESIDMEMSDEDFDNEYDDSINNYNRSLSTDSSPSLLSPNWNNTSSLDQQQQTQHHQQQFLTPWKQSQRMQFHGPPRIPFPHDNNARRPPLLSDSPAGHFQRPPYPNRRGTNTNRRGNFQPRGRPFFRGPRPWI